MRTNAWHKAARTGVWAAMLAVGGCYAPDRTTAVDVPIGGWEAPARIVVDNADTLARQEIGLFLRCNERFAEDTLTVRIVVRTPDSLRFEEPFLLRIADSHAPAALKRVIALPYRRGVLLARSGKYIFIITPARPVAGIEAVGIDLRPTQ